MDNRYIRRKQNRESLKLLYKIKAIAIKVNKSHGWNKMYICINQLNKKDILVIPYIGNEGIERTLGSDCELQIHYKNEANGNKEKSLGGDCELGENSRKRANNTICLVEYTPSGNSCKISDGIMTYTC